MDDIISYIDKNPIPFMIMVIILLFIIYKIYESNVCFTGKSDKSQLEHLNGQIANPILSQTPIPLVAPPVAPSQTYVNMDPFAQMHQLNDQFVSNITNKILVRFKYTSPDGKNYYLSLSPISTCTNTVKPDCISNALVLMDEQTMNSNVTTYLAGVQKQIKLCNYNHTLSQNPGATGPIGQTFPQCNIQPQYSTDFIITKMINGNTTKYFIQGMIPNTDPTQASQVVFLNKQKTYNNICADSFSVSQNNPYVSIDLITTQVCDNNGNKTLNTKLRFNITENDSKGNIINTPMYLSKCSNTTCNNFMRLCLVPDELDPNIVILDPIIQSYNITI